MTSNQNFVLSDSQYKAISKDETDLKQIIHALNRNRVLIAKFSLISLLLSVLIAFTTKRVWQGEFQIVVESNNSKSSLSGNSRIASLAGLQVGNNQLATEVLILKSPSVLMNIFEFVKAQKALKNNPIENLRFKDWRNGSLIIQLEKGTSILNLAYKDTDKDLVLPVLNKISATYQDYSGKRRLRSIELGEEYFINTISKYKEKSIESLRKAQEFAINQDLSILQGESKIDMDIPNSINIEAIRVQAANQIRVIDKQLEQIQDLKSNSEQIMYVASTIPAMAELSEQLKGIDTGLARLRVTYKETDKSIQDLLEERIFLIDLLKRQVRGFLIASKIDAQARLNAAERPEGVLIEYRQLLSNAAKDKSTLDQLENQYRNLLLEKARREDPWKLITQPTLLPTPVAPRKKRILAIGLIGGAFIGSAAALISDKRKDIIFSAAEVDSIGGWPLLAELSTDLKKTWAEAMELIASGPLAETEGSTSLLVIGEINEKELKEISQPLKQFLKGRELTITDNVSEAIKCSNLIVVTALGITKKQELIEAKKKLLLQNKPILGLLALNNINSTINIVS